jgi:magnesium-transporting ATPase (P-type)
MGETKYVPVGNGTEVGFLKFLQNADVPIHTLIKRRFEKVVATVPRSSGENKQFSAAAVDEGDGYINIHIKGATEAILTMVRSIMGVPGDEEERVSAEYQGGAGRAGFDKCVEEMAGGRPLESASNEQNNLSESIKPLRVIAFAHARITADQWEQ